MRDQKYLKEAHQKKKSCVVFVSDLHMLSMEMSLSCSYMDGWSFLQERRLNVDWECSLVTFIRISPVP